MNMISNLRSTFKLIIVLAVFSGRAHPISIPDRASDPCEENEGSGVIRIKSEYDWSLVSIIKSEYD